MPEAQRILAICYDETGNVYRKFMFDASVAENYYMKAIAVSERLANAAVLGRSLSHFGLLCWSQERLPEAQELLSRGLRLTSEAEGQGRGIGIRLGQLGRLKVAMRQERDGLDLINRGLEINRYHNDAQGEIRNLLYKAQVDVLMGEVYEARRTLEVGLEIAGRNGFRHLEADMRINLGDLMRDRFRQFDIAHQLYQSAFESIAEDWKRIFANPPDPDARSDPNEMERMLRAQFAKYESDLKQVTKRSPSRCGVPPLGFLRKNGRFCSERSTDCAHRCPGYAVVWI